MNNKLILTLIIVFGFILRNFYGGSIPTGLNRDEASIGYTAYSLLKTGKDEYGRFLPLSVESFGDWKLPLYIYTDILPVAFLSLNEYSARFPSIFFGTLTIYLTYLLARTLFITENKKEQIALFASFFLAISPWHIHFSRVASEANIAVFLTVSALFLFFKGLKDNRLLYASSFVLSLTLFTYHGNHIFSILMFLTLLIILFKTKIPLKNIILFTFIFTCLTVVILKATLFSADTVKISGLTPLSDKYLLYSRVTLPRLEHIDPRSILTLFNHNKIFFMTGIFLQNYIRGFSPDFLFIRGGTNTAHNIPDFGNLYMWDIVFLILGVYFLFHKNKKWKWFFLAWILISPIAPAITKDAPHSARMLAFLPVPYLISSFGLINLIGLIGRFSVQKIIINSIMILLIFNFYLFLDRYFIHFPIKEEYAWGGGYKELTKNIAALYGNYSEIVMDRPDQSPYIYFLFYWKLDPLYFQKNVVHYPIDSEGFEHVKKIGKITFKKFDWSDDIILPNRLLITWAESTPPSATKSAVMLSDFRPGKTKTDQIQEGNSGNYEIARRIVNTIKLKNGQQQFYLIDIDKVWRENP